MAESFGLMFENGGSDSRVILDSEYTRLNTIYSGTYAPNGANNIAQVNFPSPITTQEQPFVFIRPNAADGVIGMLPVVYGTPGNWTGFGVGWYNKYSVLPAGKWFAAGFGASPISDYGMRLFLPVENTIFDSGMPSAHFVRSTNTWRYTGYDYDPQGLTRSYFVAPFYLEEGEYVLINNMYMPLIQSSVVSSRSLYLTWDYPGKQLIAVTVGTTGPIYLGIPVMIGKQSN